jgi:predicted amidophosphoribosyltransferase
MELAAPREHCSNCDADIEDHYKFCPTCGHNLKGEPEESVRVASS